MDNRQTLPSEEVTLALSRMNPSRFVGPTVVSATPKPFFCQRRMTKIKLPTGTFEYDPSKPLGKPRGFGQVFLGRTIAGAEVAIKKLHVSATDAGHRELQIAAELKGRSFEHVVPFIADGRWNAPVRSASGEFAYVTITETKALRPGLSRIYDEFIPAVKRLGLNLPDWLLGQTTHLDPDFGHLTYGDQGRRGRSISRLQSGDLLAFFAGLRPVENSEKALVYALIGAYIIEEIVTAQSVPPNRWHENAHTRREPSPNNIVVRARAGVSGRLKRCIPIGEYRNRAYRVRRDLLSEWGGLDVKDGYLQRSARLPEFGEAERFYHWFLAQRPELVSENNSRL